jgi:Na+/phosphate symporter
MIGDILLILIAVVGLLMYMLAERPKVAEVGRILFFVGVFVFFARGGGELVGLLGG